MNQVRIKAIEELRRMVLAALGTHDAAVWLFGSCARGASREHSDINLAILPPPKTGACGSDCAGLSFLD
jgi:predicted nucleotidyltransferase